DRQYDNKRKNTAKYNLADASCSSSPTFRLQQSLILGHIMKIRVKIIGAGSIGNHLAYGCRRQGWEVVRCDSDSEALQRTRDEIYPGRYGHWDEAIYLAHPEETTREEFDVVIIGTPPDTHIGIALDVLKQRPPRLLLIEKPLCTPSLTDCEQLRTQADQAG